MGAMGSFLGGKEAAVWCWPVTTIQCWA